MQRGCDQNPVEGAGVVDGGRGGGRVGALFRYPSCGMTGRQTRRKALPSRNLLGGL